jgi:hypothetical protein
MAITASALRKNIWQLLDQVAESGAPLEIERKGRRLKIIAEQRSSKLSKIIKHPCIQGDPESLVHLEWADEWKGDLP